MSPTYTVASDQDRRTPGWLYRACCHLLLIDDFALDAFASADNALCVNYLDVSVDGLRQPWVDPTFVNPPFKLLRQVVVKAIQESRRGVRSVLIGPAGCSQGWFHSLWPHAVILFPDERVNFLDREGRPTKAAMQDAAVYFVDGRTRVDPEARVLPVPAEAWGRAHG